MRKIPALVLSTPILLAVASAVYLNGQTSTGVIVGSVTDPSGAVLADTSITIISPATGLTHQARTKHNDINICAC